MKLIRHGNGQMAKNLTDGKSQEILVLSRLTLFLKKKKTLSSFIFISFYYYSTFLLFKFCWWWRISSPSHSLITSCVYYVPWNYLEAPSIIKNHSKTSINFVLSNTSVSNNLNKFGHGPGTILEMVKTVVGKELSISLPFPVQGQKIII